MSYQKDRDEFISVMTKEGVPYETTRLILRDAATVSRIAVEACNRELHESETKRGEQAEKRITERLEPYGIRPKFSGDPREFVVKLLLPSGRYNTWGGAEDGFGIPTRY